MQDLSKEELLALLQKQQAQLDKVHKELESKNKLLSQKKPFSTRNIKKELKSKISHLNDLSSILFFLSGISSKRDLLALVDEIEQFKQSDTFKLSSESDLHDSIFVTIKSSIRGKKTLSDVCVSEVSENTEIEEDSSLDEITVTESVKPRRILGKKSSQELNNPLID